IWSLLTDERSRRAVEVAELYADGSATRRLLQDVRDKAGRSVSEMRATAQNDPIARYLHLPATLAAHRAVLLFSSPRSWGRGADAVSQQAALAHAGRVAGPWTAASFGQHVDADAVFGAAFHREREAHAALLRDLFGPLPFHIVRINTAW